MVTYVDTLTDMALGLAGSALAAVLLAFVFTGRRTEADRPPAAAPTPLPRTSEATAPGARRAARSA